MARAQPVPLTTSTLALVELARETVGACWPGPVVILGDGEFSRVAVQVAARFPLATIWSIDPVLRTRKPRLGAVSKGAAGREALKRIRAVGLEAELFEPSRLLPYVPKGQTTVKGQKCAPRPTIVVISKRAHTSTPDFVKRFQGAGYRVVAVAVTCCGRVLPGRQRWTLDNTWGKPAEIGGVCVRAPKTTERILRHNRNVKSQRKNTGTPRPGPKKPKLKRRGPRKQA